MKYLVTKLEMCDIESALSLEDSIRIWGLIKDCKAIRQGVSVLVCVKPHDYSYCVYDNHNGGFSAIIGDNAQEGYINQGDMNLLNSLGISLWHPEDD